MPRDQMSPASAAVTLRAPASYAATTSGGAYAKEKDSGATAPACFGPGCRLQEGRCCCVACAGMQAGVHNTCLRGAEGEAGVKH